MKILMVTSEMVPFAKVGGLADMVGALAPELARAGHDVKVVLPRYYGIDRSSFEQAGGPLGVPVAFCEEWCGVLRRRCGIPGLEVYLLDHERLYGRDGIYGTKAEPDFADNVERFTVLSRGAFQLAKMMRWTPDVIHAHDWPAALAMVYLNTWEASGEFATTAGVLTIHNLGYQGIYHKNDLHITQHDWTHFHGSGFEDHDHLNLLKAGIVNANLLTTVSPTYAAEIQSPEHGHRLDGLFRTRARDLFGVLNGMDYDEWNPETDPALSTHFSRDDLSGKAEVKIALQRAMGLPQNPAIPIVGMVSRLVDQKGVGELCGPSYGSLASICTDMAVQVVILGSGDTWCETELAVLAARYPNLAVRLAFDNQLAHLIEGGSDFFLMPSRYEPCGLNQMYSLRYGTLPIVHRTGGLADTVENYDQATGGGTGFVFELLTPRAIYDTVGWAVWAWYNRPQHITAMRRRAMAQRFSWEDAASRYAELYQWAIDRRLGRI